MITYLLDLGRRVKLAEQLQAFGAVPTGSVSVPSAPHMGPDL